MSSSISFWKMNQAYRAAAADANDRLFSDNTAYKLFSKANPTASTIPSVLTPSDPNAIINGFGQAFLNHSMNTAILAAQAGNERVQAMAAKSNNQTTTKPIGDFSNEVTFSGALSVDFGADGPADGGGYRFLSGKDLKEAFKIAFGDKRSNGEAIDTVRVEAGMLIGSTSGEKAHDVFTLSLNRETGLYTFQLVAPIDQKTEKGSYTAVYLRGLMEAVTATGQKVSLPEIEIDIYNDRGPAEGKKHWGILHEAALTYVDPSTVETTAESSATTTATKTYTVPTDPRTNRGYTTSTTAAWGVINSVNIFS